MSQGPNVIPPKRHKVLFFIPNLQQGGSERQILELMTRLPLRFEPTLCVFENKIHYAGYLPEGEPRNILRAPRMGPFGLWRLIDVLRQERPSILHSYRDKANFWARLAALLAPVPVVLTAVRNRFMSPLHLAAERFLCRWSDKVLVNSEGVRRELIDRAGVKPEAIQIIHNLIDTGRFRPPEPGERTRARRRFGLSPDEIAIVLPGRIGWQKHQLGLIYAIHLLKRAGKLPGHVRLLLVGRKRDRLISALLPRWIRWLRLNDCIRQIEPLADVLPLYHAADAVVMPSLFEGMSNAVLEAHACGLPIVASHAANIDQIVVDKETGFEVPTFNHRALADALSHLIALPAEELNRMGNRGRDHVAKRFGLERVLAETVALYDTLLARKGLA